MTAAFELADGGDGTTPVPDDAAADLKLTYITTRRELAEAEQRNIAKARSRRRPDVATLLDDGYIRDLHLAMFGQVWTWAGKYRRRELSIGIDPASIGVAVRELTADALAWVAQEAYLQDEIAVRFHHRLVQIHPFTNGNGRHSRYAADLLAMALGRDAFSWGSRLDVTTDALRGGYLNALRRLDRDGDDVDELLAFARS